MQYIQLRSYLKEMKKRRSDAALIIITSKYARCLCVCYERRHYPTKHSRDKKNAIKYFRNTEIIMDSLTINNINILLLHVNRDLLRKTNCLSETLFFLFSLKSLNTDFFAPHMKKFSVGYKITFLSFFSFDARRLRLALFPRII